jgi:hypothetical protein
MQQCCIKELLNIYFFSFSYYFRDASEISSIYKRRLDVHVYFYGFDPP